MQNKPPVNQYALDRVDAGKDRSLYEGLADFNPLGLAFTNLSDQQRDKFERHDLDPSDFEGRGLLGNFFPKWALADALKQKRTEARTQIKPAIAAQDYQYKREDYLLNRAQNERAEDAQMQFDFGSKLADRQGKLNLRQSMVNSVMQRTSSPINWLR
jgi:hypothetical protein